MYRGNGEDTGGSVPRCHCDHATARENGWSVGSHDGHPWVVGGGGWHPCAAFGCVAQSYDHDSGVWRCERALVPWYVERVI